MTKINRIPLCALTALILTLAPLAATATLVVPLSDEELVARSQRIVTGEVIETETVRLGKANRIMTRVTLIADQWLKGDREKRVEFLIPGGTIGEVTARVSGVQPFQPAQQVLLFASANETTQRLEVTGLAQGRFDILVDADSQRQLLARDLSGISFYHPETGAIEEVKRDNFKQAERSRRQAQELQPEASLSRIGAEAAFYDYEGFVQRIRDLVKEEGR